MMSSDPTGALRALNSLKRVELKDEPRDGNMLQSHHDPKAVSH
jgi:hypothetical protein